MGLKPQGFFIVIAEETRYRHGGKKLKERGRILQYSSETKIGNGLYAVEPGSFGSLERDFADQRTGTDCIEYGKAKKKEISERWGIPESELRIYRAMGEFFVRVLPLI